MVVYKHLDQKAAFSISQHKSKIEMLHLSKKWSDIEMKFPISVGMNQVSLARSKQRGQLVKLRKGKL